MSRRFKTATKDCSASAGLDDVTSEVSEVTLSRSRKKNRGPSSRYVHLQRRRQRLYNVEAHREKMEN